MLLDEVQAKSGRTEVTSVVCFAFADMVAIRSLQAEIPGDHVQLVPGIDRDLEGLVVQLLGDAPAVIVVAHSSELSAARLEEVLATFSKQRDRNHRLCVVEFDQGSPAAFLDGVGAAVDDMRGRSTPSPVASRPAGGPNTTRRRPPTAVPAAAVQSRPSAIGVAEAPGQVAEAPCESSEPSGEVTSQTTASQGAGEDVLSTTNPGPSDSGTTFPDLSASISNVRRGRAARARRQLVWRRAAIGMLVVGGLGSVAWMGGVSGLGNGAAEVATAAGPELPVRKASLAPPRSPQPASDTRAPVKPRSVPPAPSGSADDAAAESRRVAAALDAKQMHALDALLIRVASREPEGFSEARKRCARLDVASLQGWRLPSLDELRTLRRARMLVEGEYWSTSRVGGTSQFTLSRDVTRPQERDRSDLETVKTLCVRQR